MILMTDSREHSKNYGEIFRRYLEECGLRSSPDFHGNLEFEKPVGGLDNLLYPFLVEIVSEERIVPAPEFGRIVSPFFRGYLSTDVTSLTNMVSHKGGDDGIYVRSLRSILEDVYGAFDRVRGTSPGAILPESNIFYLKGPHLKRWVSKNTDQEI